MEPWKDSCCSRREASAELGDQDRIIDTGYVSKLCVKTLFLSGNFVAFFAQLGIVIF